MQAYVGQRTFPVPALRYFDARLCGRHAAVFCRVTDESGIFGDILLPAPNNALAQSPTGEMPYALYDIRVSHRDAARKFTARCLFSRCDVDTAGAVFGGR